MEKITFIHAADLHLDSPFKGLAKLPDEIFHKVKESTFAALDRIVNYAIEERVDFVTLCGDLFDGENRSMRAQSKLKKALEKLNEHEIACYIIHGNHDHLNGNWVSFTWPENVFFFESNVTHFTYQKNETTVNLYGFSYPTKHVYENRTSDYKRLGEADYHIGLLHGQVEGSSDHDPYAPFTISELVGKNFHYWALGHIHKRQVLHKDPYVIYPGNTQGRHKNETGEKGCYLIELNGHATALTFLPTSIVYWEEVDVSINEIETTEQLMTEVENVIESLRKENGSGTLVHLKFKGQGALHQFLAEQLDTLVDTLCEGEENKDNFVWITSYENETMGKWNRQQLKNESHIVADIIDITDKLQREDFPLNGILGEAFDHPKIKRYVASFTDKEQKQLLHEAETMILSELLKESGK